MESQFPFNSFCAEYRRRIRYTERADGHISDNFCRGGHGDHLLLQQDTNRKMGADFVWVIFRRSGGKFNRPDLKTVRG